MIKKNNKNNIGERWIQPQRLLVFVEWEHQKNIMFYDDLVNTVIGTMFLWLPSPKCHINVET